MPGVEDVLARFFCLVTILISEDLPTLLRPIKAYSGLSGFGHWVTNGEEMMYLADLISMVQSKDKLVVWS